MNRYDEYMKEVQEKKKENQAIVNKIAEILKGNNLTVEHIEVVHVYRTRISLHGREYICHRHSRQLHFVAVDIEI